MPVMTDMHAHLSCIQELEEGKISWQEAKRRGAEGLIFRQSSKIRTFVSTGRPWEWELLQELLRENGARRAPGSGGRNKAQREDAGTGRTQTAVQRYAPGSGGQNKAQRAEAETGGMWTAAHRFAPECGAQDEAQYTEPASAAQTMPDSVRQIIPDFVRVSFGIHPWYADRFDPADWPEAFGGCDAVGEIGMDSVWCEMPLPLQRKRLMQQLQIAADLKKPVVLHTKGCEAEIAELLRGFSEKILIHWFSGTQAELEKFLDLDCYFTLGPDLAAVCGSDYRPESGTVRQTKSGADCRPENGTDWKIKSRVDCRPEARPDCQLKSESNWQEKSGLYPAMLREIPENRLFLETDGRSAVEWALGRPVTEAEIPDILSANLHTAAAARYYFVADYAHILEDNFHKFLSGKQLCQS